MDVKEPRYGYQEVLINRSKYFKRDLAPSNIKVGFKWTRIWLLNPNALLHDTICSQDFDVHDNEYADVVDKILSLSKKHY